MLLQSATSGRIRGRQILLCLLSALLGLALASVARAAGPGAELEVLQMKATLQYNDRDYPGAISTLSELLHRRPDDVAALELLALCQQSTDRRAAAATYVRLLGMPETARAGAYHFELGTLLFQARDPAAGPHFVQSLARGFNPGVSQFFLGLIAVSAKDWREARDRLEAARELPGATPLRRKISFQLGQVYTELGRPADAARNYLEAAGGQAESVDAISGNIRQSALKELRKLDRSGYSGALSLISQWDNNVQSNPNDVKNPVPPTFQRTLKSVFSGGITGSSSPLRTVQLLSTMRLFTNYNFNKFTRDFDFVSLSPSLLAMVTSWERLTYGLKGELAYSLKNTLDTTSPSATTTYQSFSLTGDVGAVARYTLTPELQLAAELSWRPKKFFQDATSGSTRRTGQGYFARVGAELIRDRLLNPSAYFTFEQDIPAGSDFRFIAFGGGLADAMQLTERLTVTPMLELSSTAYYNTSPIERIDLFISARISAQYQLATHWSVLADLALMRNGSSVPASFSYDRTLASAGATYSF